MKTLVAGALLVLGMASSGWAYQYNLTQLISGGTYSPLGMSLGTVTITDDVSNTNNVDVTFALNNGLKLIDFVLNYSGTPVPDANMALDGNTNLIQFGTFTLNGTGNYTGQFDIQAPDNGSLHVGNPYTGVISDGLLNLNASNFDTLDSLGNFHVAAHIGAGTGQLPGGAPSLSVGDGAAPSVPEPGTMMLLGGGFLGLAIYGKRRKNS